MLSTLAEKAEGYETVDPALFENEEESLGGSSRVTRFIRDCKSALEQLFALSPVIDAFFENTMVMTDDQDICQKSIGHLVAIN